MERNEVISITNEVNQAQTIKKLNILEDKYSYLNHPYKFYLFGVNYKIKQDDNKAFKCFINAGEIGIMNYNKYLDTYFSDSIGSSLSLILTNFSLEKISSGIKYNLFANSYIFLSSAINCMGTKAYESYQNRAILLKEFDGDLTTALILNYLALGVISKVLFLSDYFFASQGFNKFGLIESAQLCIRNSINLHNWLEDITVNGKDADSYTIEEISNIGKQRHEILYHNSKQDFINNKFIIDFNSIRTIYPAGARL